MQRQHAIAGAPEVSLTVRIRGLSQEQRFFDEQTTTSRVTREFIVVRLHERVDLDAELHVTNMRTQVGGTYRVAWTGWRPETPLYSAGLELLDPEGEIWEDNAIVEAPEIDDAPPVVRLECQRCCSRISISVPEADYAAVGEGFSISRHCDGCKATTGWVFYTGSADTAEAPPEESPVAGTASLPGFQRNLPTTEKREKGRAPIKLGIKIIRSKYGTASHDVGETINISRTGAYFTTNQAYEPGEIVSVVLPYQPGAMEIPVRARVIRNEEVPGVYQRRVAIHLLTGGTQH